MHTSKHAYFVLKNVRPTQTVTRFLRYAQRQQNKTKNQKPTITTTSNASALAKDCASCVSWLVTCLYSIYTEISESIETQTSIYVRVEIIVHY